MSKNLNIKESVTAIEAPMISKGRKDQAKDKVKEFMTEETRLVKGIFQCFETPGSEVKVIVRKYPGIPQFEKVMRDGETYEIPLYVARHLNGVDVTAGALGDNPNPNIGTCSYVRNAFVLAGRNAEPGYGNLGTGANGQSGIPVPIVGIGKRIRRYGFQSMEFAAGAA